MKGIARARYGCPVVAIGLFALREGLSGCEGWTPAPDEEPSLDPSRFRRALVEAQERLTRFVVRYVRRQEAFWAGKRLDRQAVSRLLEEALAAYERTHGVTGVLRGYRRAQLVLAEARSGDRLTAWWDSLGLDAEQQVWMGRLWEVFRTSHTVAELDRRLGRYEEEVVAALGAERSGVLLWSAGVLYSVAVLVFGREEWVEAFWALVGELMGESGGSGGMARWGVLGGRGWIRLAQQGLCELNSMPQIGDYRTVEGALAAILTGAWEGCGLGAALGGLPGCLVYMPIGMGIRGLIFALRTKQEYNVDITRWCRQNLTNCRNNEYYLRACNELINAE